MGCSDDDSDAARSTTTAEPTTATTGLEVEDDPSLVAHLLDPESVPPGFAPTGDEIDDTVTAFCAGEDATAGLSASGRAAAGFTRTPPGASIIQLVFRFEDGGAADFVAAADAILSRCSDVPDMTGLAFTYEAVAPEVAATLAAADASTSRHGTSVGSESLTIDVAVVRHGDVGQLVAVLGLDLPRDELDELARQTFAAAMALAPRGAS